MFNRRAFSQVLVKLPIPQRSCAYVWHVKVPRCDMHMAHALACILYNMQQGSGSLYLQDFGQAAGMGNTALHAWRHGHVITFCRVMFSTDRIASRVDARHVQVG